MAPQDDLTAERAASKCLDQAIYNVLYGDDNGDTVTTLKEHLKAAFADALQTARREALREGRDYALACVHERATQLDGFTGSSEMAGVIRGKQSEAQRIADELDRLASEGG